MIATEAAALYRLSDSLGDEFASAATMISSGRGRIVATGMGKSGHVARKIAATLASINIPALFIHPAEAAHGDLGMLIPGDTLIALSNSGSTRELLPILDHAKAAEIPIIGIASMARSPLMARADIRLLLPPAEEAGPAKLAPTTSTAMMMALGDALAMVAMEIRGWSRYSFAALHPGGAIGSQLGRIASMMHAAPDIPLVGTATPMPEVIVTMTSFSFGIAGVTDDDGRLLGVITDGDLRRHIDDLLTCSAGEVMTHRPITANAEGLAEEAMAAMKRNNITALFVTDSADGHRPLGLVHIHDFLRFGIW